MSPELQRKNITQGIILVVLLVVLGCLFYFMILRPKQPQHSSGPSRSEQAPPPAAAPAATPAPADEQPQYGTAGAQEAQTQAQADEVAPQELAVTEGLLNMTPNPDQFKVFALSPPKNPFAQQERWYSAVLEEKLPGYPELRDSGYFESMEAYLPNVDQYFEEPKDWSVIRLSRQQQPPAYSFEGQSADGDIQTRLELVEKSDPAVDLSWSADSGVPLSALRTPGWSEKYADELYGTSVDGEASSTPQGLDVPGLPGTAAAPAGGGDAIKLAGVNLKGPTSSALILYNDAPFLVSESSVLPTHYQVLAIKADGIVLLELRSGESKWIPLGGGIGGDPTKKR